MRCYGPARTLEDRNKMLSPWRDSNPWPLDNQTCALPVYHCKCCAPLPSWLGCQEFVGVSFYAEVIFWFFLVFASKKVVSHERRRFASISKMSMTTGAADCVTCVTCVTYDVDGMRHHAVYLCVKWHSLYKWVIIFVLNDAASIICANQEFEM